MSHQVFIDENYIVTLKDRKVDDITSMKSDGHVHVIPNSQFFNHVDNSACGCKPKWDEKNRIEYVGSYAEVQVWIHRSDKELTQ